MTVLEMMKLQNPQTRNNLVNRLKRIEGQVRGVQKMIDEERQCDEIVQQLVSIRSAVHGAVIHFLQEQARECFVNPAGQDEREQERSMTELITLLGKIT